MTDALVGGTFVQPQFIDYEGSRALIFVFSVSAIMDLFSSTCMLMHILLSL